MAKMNESELALALAPFYAIIKGWSACSKEELDLKIQKAWTEINRLKGSNGPWKKAKADLDSPTQRWLSLGGLSSDLQQFQKAPL